MAEEWRPVAGFEGFYEVSDLGRVRSCARYLAGGNRPRSLPDRLMTGAVKNNGYVLISLRKPREKQVKRLLHRLVAIAFIPARADAPEVNHRDGDKLNNVVSNLEWCTHAENMAHAWDSGLIPLPRRAA